MNKSAIAIYGPSTQGKSATIREVFNQLISAFPNHTIHHSYDDGDITYIIEINGVKIGIESLGDPNGRLPESLQDFVDQKCDIIVCACRTRGKTVADVESLYDNHHYEIIWSTNHRSGSKVEHQDQLNQMSANGIVELIKRIMNGQL